MGVLGAALTVLGLYFLLTGEVDVGLSTLGGGGFCLLLFFLSLLIWRLRTKQIRARTSARAQPSRHHQSYPQQHAPQGSHPQQHPQQHPQHQQQWASPPQARPRQQPRPGPQAPHQNQWQRPPQDYPNQPPRRPWPPR